jgi:lipopolysaccharide exporter
MAVLLAQLPFTMIMARLLTPRDFGLVAVSVIMLRFVGYFAQGGVGSAVVQKPALDSADVRAAFTLVLSTAVAGYALFWAFAPLAAIAFHEPALTNLSRALATSVVLGALGVVGNGLLRRRLRYAQVSMFEVVGYIVGYCVVGILLALLGAGVWSLVGAAVTQTTIVSVASLLAARHPVRPLLDAGRMRAISAFGVKSSLVSLLEFLSASLDPLVIGQRSGAVPMGQYNRASLLASMPLQRVANTASRTAFPAFSRLQADPRRLASGYLDAVLLLAITMVPVAAVLAVSAPAVVGVLLGRRWSTVAHLVPMLAFVSVLDLLTQLPAVAAEAMGRLGAKIAIQLGYLCLLGALLAWITSAGYGLVGIAFAVLLAQLGRHVCYLLLMSRLAAGTSWPVLRGYAQSLAAAAAVAAPAAAAGAAMAAAADWMILLTQAAAAALAAVGLLPLRWRFDAYRAAIRRGLLPPDGSLPMPALGRGPRPPPQPEMPGGP